MDNIRFSLDPVPLADAAGHLWKQLEAGSNESFFVSWAWIGTWLRCLPGHIRPHLLTARRGGEPIGAAVLVPRRERRWGVLDVAQLRFNTTGDRNLDSIWIEHNGFAASSEAQGELWPAFLRWFAKEGTADELVVPRAGEQVVGPSCGSKLLHAVNTLAGFRARLVPGGVDAVLAALSANARQQLRRNLRACEAFGELRCEEAGSVETALAWFGAMKALHIASWNRRSKPHGFRYPFVETFHRALIETGVPEGSVSLLRISAGTVTLGYLYNFRHGGTVSAYQSGFDYGREELRPGYVCHLLAMATSAQEGANCYDFLGGDNRLKRSLASERYALCSHRFGRPLAGLRLESFARSVRKRLRF